MKLRNASTAFELWSVRISSKAELCVLKIVLDFLLEVSNRLLNILSFKTNFVFSSLWDENASETLSNSIAILAIPLQFSQKSFSLMFQSFGLKHKIHLRIDWSSNSYRFHLSTAVWNFKESGQRSWKRWKLSNYLMSSKLSWFLWKLRTKTSTCSTGS